MDPTCGQTETGGFIRIEETFFQDLIKWNVKRDLLAASGLFNQRRCKGILCFIYSV